MLNEWLILIVAGCCGGLLAGLFGIGGGLIIVPVLYFYLQAMQVNPELAMAMAINTSLVSIIPTALSSMRAHHVLGNVDWSIVRRWAPFTIIGVLLGSLLVAYVRSPVFTSGFGLLLLFIALQKTLFTRRYERPLPAVFVQAICAAIIGFISVCAGVGGGATGVPVMRFMGVPIRRAIGTSAALGFFVALPGAFAIIVFSQPQADAPPGSYHLVYSPALLLLAPGTILLAPLGARINKHLSSSTLNRAFAVLLVVVGLKMLTSAF